MTRVNKAPEERRKELVLAAEKLFFEKGYTDTTVRDIINAVGGSQGMFYHYFSSKDDIYRAAIDEFKIKYVKKLRSILFNESISIQEKIKKMLFTFQETYNRGLPIFHVQGEENHIYVMQLKFTLLDFIKESFEKIINDAIDEGLVKRENIYNGDVKSISIFLASGLFGFVNSNELFNEETVRVDTEELNSMIAYISKVLGINLEFVK